MGSFVNLSEGITAITPEVPQFPYTGPVLKKNTGGAGAGAGAGGAAAAAAAPSNAKGPLPVIVPSFAAWFDLAAIHEIERACTCSKHAWCECCCDRATAHLRC